MRLISALVEACRFGKIHTQSVPGLYVSECGMLNVAEMMFPLSARSGLTSLISVSDSRRPPILSRLMRRSRSRPEVASGSVLAAVAAADPSAGSGELTSPRWSLVK